MVDKMKRKISYDRLIELAEGSGRITPTANEQRLFDSDPVLRAELETITKLFAGLRELPEKRVDPAALPSILAAVRQGITSRHRSSPLAWLSSGNLLGNAIAAGVSFALVLGALLVTGHFNGGAISPPAIEDPESLEMAIGLSGGNMIYEASALSGIDLFTTSGVLSDTEAASEFLSHDTYSLMAEAANLEDDIFVQINEQLGLDKK
jgi:hypothetical protein